MTILQQVPLEAISINTVLGFVIITLLSIIGFFLVRNMSKMDEIIQRHETMLNRHDKEIEVLQYKSGDNGKVLDEILTKIDHLKIIR